MLIGRAAPRNGTWTPVLTFVTPGDLSVAYSAQLGQWYLDAGILRAYFQIVTTTFTYTTASGAARITGLPYTVKTSTLSYAGNLSQIQGVTKASYTQFAVNALSATTTLAITASGSGQTTVGLAVADMPSATQQTLTGFVQYPIA